MCLECYDHHQINALLITYLIHIFHILDQPNFMMVDLNIQNPWPKFDDLKHEYHSTFVPYLTFVWPCIMTNFFIINQTDALISQIYFGRKICMFQTVPLSIIRSFSLYIQQWYVIQFCWQLASGIRMILLTSCQQTCMTYTIAVCTVKNSFWWTEELSKTCRVSFQNKFKQLVHLVGLL